MLDSQEIHWKVAKIILRYLRGIVGYGLVYRSTNDFNLIGYRDLYWAGCMDDRKSTSGYTFNMGLAIVAWSIKKQPSVSLSIAEVQYKATVTTACEAMWLGRIFLRIHISNRNNPHS
jgi:hypothetical protein